MRRIALALLLATPAAAQRPPQPLFASDSVLELRIEADLRNVFKERGEEGKPYPATITMAGVDRALPAQLQTRGHYRLRRSTCAMPPLRVRFAKDAPELAGTPFAGQRKLKLVTHCQPGREFEDNLVEEYLVYRSYNAITDTSFRVRLARVTYVDRGDAKAEPVTRYAFFIEDDERMAERIGGKILPDQGAAPGDLHMALLEPLVMFQYMVGNTDWSIGALHNIRLVRTGDAVLPVPYDFDWSGVVGAPYARPNPKFGTKTIYDRVFMIGCLPLPSIVTLAGRFNARRDSIYTLFRDTTLLDRRAGENDIRYLEEFYKTLNNERVAKRVFGSGC